MSLLIAALVFYVAVFLATCAYALLKGGAPERAGALVIFVATITSQIASLMGTKWEGPEYGVMAVDALTLVAFVVIALRSTRFWPIWAAAAQLVGTLTHLSKVLEPSIMMVAYASTQPFWAFPVLLALALGTRAHQRSGAERS